MVRGKAMELLRPAMLLFCLGLTWMVRAEKERQGYLILILDNSGSVLEADVKKEKNFAKALTRALHVGKDGVRIGVITLSTGANIFVNLSEGTDPDYITRQIDKIEANQGTSEFAAALIQAYNMLLGLRYSTRQYPRLVVLIGDGDENCKPNDCIMTNCKNPEKCHTKCPAQKSLITNQSYMVTHVAAAKLMVLGVGKEAPKFTDRLDCWATEGLFYPLQNYDELINKINAEITSFFLCKYTKMLNNPKCMRTGPIGRCQMTVIYGPAKESRTCNGTKTKEEICSEDECGGKPVIPNYPDTAKVLYSAKPGSGFPWWWVLLIIVILLIILVLIVVVAMMAAKKKKKKDFQVEDAAVGGTVRQDTIRSQRSRIATKRQEERDMSVQPTSGIGQTRSRGQVSGIAGKLAEEKDMSVQPSSAFGQTGSRGQVAGVAAKRAEGKDMSAQPSVRFGLLRSETEPAPIQLKVGSHAPLQHNLPKAESKAGAFSKKRLRPKSKVSFAE